MFSLLNDNEMWLDVEGHEGLYSVSNYGRVWSHQRGGRILKPGDNGNGYLHVNLYKDKIQKTDTVHSLVGNAFVGKREHGMTFDHIDRNKLNNEASNLRLATRSEQSLNQKTRFDNHLGEKNIYIFTEYYCVELRRKGIRYLKYLRMDDFSLADAVKVRDKILADLN